MLQTSLTRALAISALLAVGSAAAQQGGGQGSGAGGGGAATTRAEQGTAGGGERVASGDSGFLEQAAQNGHAEMSASKVALEKSKNPDVRAFAEKMVAEHGKMHQELASLAQRKGVKLPDGPSLMQRAQAKMLSGKDGAEFDRDYAEKIGVKAHEDTVEMFRKAAAEAKDPDVKMLAQKSLPALEQHLQMAQALNQKVGGQQQGKR